jgi:hypothetical protein
MIQNLIFLNEYYSLINLNLYLFLTIFFFYLSFLKDFLILTSDCYILFKYQFIDD